VNSNSVNKYFNIKDGVRLTQRRRDEITRWVENEQFMCFSSAEYFLTRYAWICGVGEEVFRYDPRDSQKIFHSIIAEFDEKQVAIELFILKARQLGVSTAVAVYFLHRILFRIHTRAVMASVQQKQSDLIGRIQDTCWNRLPFWLPPAKTVMKTSTPEWANGSILSIQSGSQAFGIAQGWTPSAIHISEVGDIPNPKKTLEEGLFRAAHSHKDLFFVMEGTGNGDTGWQAEKWRYYKENWGRGGRFRPIFIPPACAKDIYPLPDWIKKNPIPENWRPTEKTLQMQRKGELYIRSTYYLARAMGSNFKMSREYLWYWDCQWREAVASHMEKVWLGQMPCVTGDTMVSTEKGIMPIAEAYNVKQCESGAIEKWLPKGEKPVIELKTEDGRILRGTRDHRIYTTTGKEVQLGDLKPGMKIVLTPPMFAEQQFVAKWSDTDIYQSERIIDERMGRLLGYFMGDGCFHSGELSVACSSLDEDTILDVTQLIEEICGKRPANQRVGNMVRVRSPYAAWTPFLKALGVIKPVPHEGRTDGFKRKVHVPDCIFRSPKPVVREFLSALYECDGWGSKDGPRVSLCSAYDPFLRQVQLLLLGFGIRAKMMKPRIIMGASIKGAKKHQYTRRTLDIPGAFANTFYDEIGFTGTRKQTGGKRQTSLRYAEQTFEDEVVMVTDTGDHEPVYDLSVAKSHFFSANGIKVHNCTDTEALQSKHDLVMNHESIEVITREREKSYVPYAITGKTILMGSANSPYEPNPAEVDYDRERIPVRWNANDGNTYDWELVPLQDFDDSSDGPCLDKLLIFQEPKEGVDYSIGVDCADGLGMPNEDRSTISVLINRSGRERDEQVAAFTSLQVNSPQMARIAACVAALYGAETRNSLGCKMAIEQRRKPGDECQHQLKIMGFYNHHRMVMYDSTGLPDPSKAHKEGFYTNSWSRPMMLNKFFDALNTGYFKPNCPILIRQLKAIIRIETGGQSKIDHASGQHDDNVFASGMAYFTAHDMDNNAMRQESRYSSAEERNPVIDMRWSDNSVVLM
jgi:intein/homing endonuclease